MINLTIINFSHQIHQPITTHETVFRTTQKILNFFFWVKIFKRRRRKPTTGSLFASPFIIFTHHFESLCFILLILWGCRWLGFFFFFFLIIIIFFWGWEGVFLLRVNGRLTVLILLSFFIKLRVKKTLGGQRVIQENWKRHFKTLNMLVGKCVNLSLNKYVLPLWLCCFIIIFITVVSEILTPLFFNCQRHLSFLFSVHLEVIEECLFVQKFC